MTHTRDMEWLRQRIEYRGMTQKSVADAIGLTEKKMSEVIGGTRLLKSVEILPLSRVLMVSPITILRQIAGERGTRQMGEPSKEAQEQLFELISQLDDEKLRQPYNF